MKGRSMRPFVLAVVYLVGALGLGSLGLTSAVGADTGNAHALLRDQAGSPSAW